MMSLDDEFVVADGTQYSLREIDEAYRRSAAGPPPGEPPPFCIIDGMVFVHGECRGPFTFEEEEEQS